MAMIARVLFFGTGHAYTRYQKSNKMRQEIIFSTGSQKIYNTEGPAARRGFRPGGSVLSCLIGLATCMLLYCLANPESGILHLVNKKTVNPSTLSAPANAGEPIPFNGKMGLASEQ